MIILGECSKFFAKLLAMQGLSLLGDFSDKITVNRLELNEPGIQTQE